MCGGPSELHDAFILLGGLEFALLTESECGAGSFAGVGVSADASKFGSVRPGVGEGRELCRVCVGCECLRRCRFEARKDPVVCF